MNPLEARSGATKIVGLCLWCLNSKLSSLHVCEDKFEFKHAGYLVYRKKKVDCANYIFIILGITNIKLSLISSVH